MIKTQIFKKNVAVITSSSFNQLEFNLLILKGGTSPLAIVASWTTLSISSVVIPGLITRAAASKTSLAIYKW
jgi:hypothetical protein